MDSNISIIVGFLRGKGLNDAQIAGVLGNIQVESNFSPDAHNDAEQAIGLCQWEGGRRTALQAYARENGSTETDIHMQLGYLWQELSGSEHGAYEALLSAKTASDAASVWDTQFERSSGSTHQLRINNAEKFATVLDSGGIPTSDVSVGTSSGGTGTGGSTNATDTFGMPSGRTLAELQQQYDKDTQSWEKLLGVDLQTGAPLQAGQVADHSSQADVINLGDNALQQDQSLGHSLGNSLGSGLADSASTDTGSLHEDASSHSAWDVGHH